MKPLTSTNLSGFDYDPETKTLSIEFRSGAVYTFAGVDQDTASGLESSLSPGSYFATNIKNRFPYTRIT